MAESLDDVFVTTTDLKIILKGKIPVGYLRISSSEQERGNKAGMPSQKSSIKRALKEVGVRKEPVWFQEQISGGKPALQREQQAALITYIMEQKDPSKYFIVVDDFQRWSRHTIYGASDFRILYDAGVEMVSIADRKGTGGPRHRPDPNGEFTFGLMVTLGGMERTTGAKRSKRGIIHARETKARIGGQPMDPDQPWETLVENIQRFDLPQKDENHLGLLQTSKKWRVTRGWLRGARDRLRAFRRYLTIQELDEKKELQKWLDIMMRLRQTKRIHGKESTQYKNAQGGTSGVLKKPDLYWPFAESNGSEKAFAEYEDVK